MTTTRPECRRLAAAGNARMIAQHHGWYREVCASRIIIGISARFVVQILILHTDSCFVLLAEDSRQRWGAGDVEAWPLHVPRTYAGEWAADVSLETFSFSFVEEGSTPTFNICYLLVLA